VLIAIGQTWMWLDEQCWADELQRPAGAVLVGEQLEQT
jgi:hypothetical protein